LESEILDRLQAAQNKGELLESLLQDVLQDLGFTHVRRQLAGSQFGFDLAAHRQDPTGNCEVWKFECKNLASAVSIDHIAPKLIYHMERAVLDVFVIVSVKPLNNNLHSFLEHHPFPMRIEAWCDSYLESLIMGSPRARKRLGLTNVGARVTRSCPQIYPQREPYSVNMVHQNDPPNAFDYVLADGAVVKAYASAGFRGLVLITNGSKSTFTIHALTLQTVKYLSSTDRVLIVEKPMGFWEPVTLAVKPTIYPGSEVDLLEGRLLNVQPGSFGMILTLAKGTAPGLYWLSLNAAGQVDGRSIRISSPQSVLHVRSSSEDTVRLWVLGRFYDSPARQLLTLPHDMWERVREVANDDEQWTFIGPAPPETLKGVKDKEWLLRAVALTEAANGKKTLSLQAESKVVFSLGTPVDEDVYSVKDARHRALETDQASQILLNQLSRKEDRENRAQPPAMTEDNN
jgi:hypothetical protein